MSIILSHHCIVSVLEQSLIPAAHRKSLPQVLRHTVKLEDRIFLLGLLRYIYYSQIPVGEFLPTKLIEMYQKCHLMLSWLAELLKLSVLRLSSLLHLRLQGLWIVSWNWWSLKSSQLVTTMPLRMKRIFHACGKLPNRIDRLSPSSVKRAPVPWSLLAAYLQRVSILSLCVSTDTSIGLGTGLVLRDLIRTSIVPNGDAYLA